MENILLSIIVYILGIFTGIIIPLVVYKYYCLFNKKEENKQEEIKQETNNPNNLTADIISEWQNGKVVGDDDE